jgi:hypothetical protein
MTGFKGKRKRGLTLTPYKKPFRYRSFAMCSIRTDLLKQENEKIEFVDLSRLQFTSDESEFIPDYI